MARFNSYKRSTISFANLAGRRMKEFLAVSLWAVLAVSPATAHQIGSHTSGTGASNLPSVEGCATFEWAEQGRCERYDTGTHHWKVINKCPRAILVRWADNAYEGINGTQPVERGKTGKPILEKARDVPADETLEASVDCVDEAELAICIAYVYPPLKEHAAVDCDDFFD